MSRPSLPRVNADRSAAAFAPIIAIAFAVALVVASSPLGAQQQTQSSTQQQQHLTGGNEGKRPIGWLTRSDAASDVHGDKHDEAKADQHEDNRKSDTLAFAQMTPGFHVTTGPGTVFWHPDSVATGAFTIESSIFLFPTKGRDREGYGVFIGGKNLDGPNQRYTYFLIRNDGRFLVKQRVGENTIVLKDWTVLKEIKQVLGKDAQKNDLRVVVDAQSVTFTVNGTTAIALPKSQIASDGIFGLRFNHAVNAHVTKVGRGS